MGSGHFTTKKRSAIILLVAGTLVFCFFPRQLDSAPLTSVKDTLESSRFSFHGKNNVALTTGTTTVVMASSGTPSTSTNNLFAGDTVTYLGSANTYTVNYIIDSTSFVVTAGLAAADCDANDEFVVKRTASHTVTATTASAIANGALRIRIKAATSSNNDGNPDQTGFDFNSAVAGDVTCPGDVTNYYDFVSGTATVSGGTDCAAGYHCFECRYSGPGNPSQALSFTIGSSNKLINPSPSSGHTTPGAADTLAVLVDNLDSTHTVIDSTSFKVAVVEAVRVTATVDPTLTFAISGISADSGSYCGVTRSASSPDSTAVTVPFGSITLAAFNDAVQQLSAVTNSSSGYAVTAAEGDQLKMVGGTTELGDTTCDGGADTCNETTTAADWNTTNTNSAFGYSIQNIDASKVAFAYSASDCSGAGYTGDITCTACTGGSTAFCAMKFPALADTESPLTIMKNTSTPSTTEDIYVCYRLTASSLQAAGSYENYVTYRATATF